MSRLTLIFSFVLLILASACSQQETINRTQDFNADWKFTIDSTIDASVADYDDSSWRTVDVPHDWSIEFAPDSVNGEGCTAYYMGGLGWYRKHFTLNLTENQKAYVHFDGVYNNSEVYLNGKKLGEHPYGYSPFFFDLSESLKSGKNVLAVKVDHTRYADSRWYSGSGIYRSVELVVTNKLHIPVWGTFITTPKVSAENATVQLDVELQNDYSEEKTIDVVTEVYDTDKNLVTTISDENIAIKESRTITQNGAIENPNLWGIDNPYLYTAETILKENGKEIDRYTTRFGVRSIRFDAEKGFFLNEENMKIKGVCLHHDGGLVGAAVPKGVWKRRLQILKDGGCNAVRISHNPGSDEFLDLCDEMGMLVQDEFFDEWDYPKDKRKNRWDEHDDYISRGYADIFQQWAEHDLKSTMKAHRNHPSVFQWSIGNEIEWTYPRNRQATGFFNNMSWQGNYFWSQPPYTTSKIKEVYNSLPALEYNIGETAQKLADWTRELDLSRPVIANCILPSASFETGYADALDIIGFSYRRVMYDYARENYPDKVCMGTENLGQWHEWKAIEERDFISGTFLWTGIDYLGEATNRWPAKGLTCGLIDAAGFDKPGYHMYKTLWKDEPHIYMCTNTAENSQYVVKNGKVMEKKEGAWEQALWMWYDVNDHWNYSDNEATIVEVISNCEEVELFLNKKSLGTKKLADFSDRIYKWAVPFTSGNLVAVGKNKDGDIKTTLVTASEPASVQLSIDNSELTGNDVAHIVAQLVDKDGNPVNFKNAEIEFDIQGDVKLLGVDNGSMKYNKTYQTNKIPTHKGHALLIVQAGKTAGEVSITASGKGIESQAVSLLVK